MTPAIVGAGLLGSMLARGLARAGYGRVIIVSRRRLDAQRAAAGLRVVRVAPDPLAAARSAEVVLLAVPDRAIAPLAERLARGPRIDWSERVVLHHAGALGIDPLESLAREGASVGVLHPLLALGPESAASEERRERPRARIEGDPRARRVAARLARDLGWAPLRLSRRLDAEDRALYHAAASIASNDVVALLAVAADLLESVGATSRDARAAVAALARSALDRASMLGLERGVTGPVVRGDAATIARHLEALSRRSRTAAEAHRLLSLEIAARTPLTPRLRRALESVLASGPSPRRKV